MQEVPLTVLQGFITTIRPWYPKVTIETLRKCLDGQGTPAQLPPALTLTTRQAAERGHVHPKTITNWCKRGLLTRVALGNRICRIRLDELDRLLTEGTR